MTKNRHLTKELRKELIRERGGLGEDISGACGCVALILIVLSIILAVIIFRIWSKNL